MTNKSKTVVVYHFQVALINTQILLFADDATFLGTHTYSGKLRVNVWLVKDDVNGGTRRIGVTENNCLRTSLSSITGGPGK